MQVPSYIWLFVFAALIALGCADIGGRVVDYFGGGKPAGVFVSIVLFATAYKVLLRWHRRVWEIRDAA